MRNIDVSKTLIILFFSAIICFASLFLPMQKISATSLTSAQGAVLMEAESKRILLEVNPHRKLPMASTTKILTALVVIENANLDERITIPKEAQGVEGSSIYLRTGEHLTVRELLYGLMLQSGNDCAVALAMHVGGSVEKFAQLMNQRAIELGAKNSSFANPHGLAHKNHYTTAYDLALISCFAMQNKIFAEIAQTKSIKISNEGMDWPRVINNKNKLLSSFDGANGVKTGFTKQAGRCFVGAAKRNDMQLVAVVLNCGPMFEDSKRMMEYGFANYNFVNISPNFRLCGNVAVANRPNCEVGTMIPQEISLPLTKTEVSQLRTNMTLPNSISAPIAKGSEIGKLDVYIVNQLIFSTNIVTMNEVK